MIDRDNIPTAPYTVYTKGIFNIVPSYNNQDEYALPGHTKDTPRPTVTAEQLRAAGFVAERRELWLRAG